ncbi:MAG: hypothetical protein JO348_00390 [Alphaproteobacteria bacterium]|nr:hypothetical protein [Alphaproteobacteria bacterium]MBV9418204.1 hypothetical protein [Alphaproteobacteria bacterium]
MGTLLVTADALRDFIAARAIPLPHFDGATLDIEHFAPLDARLAQTDYVALGELNHFIHQKSDFRLWCARWLIDRSWSTFAEELGWSDGVRANRYLATGDEGELDRLPSFGYEGHLRSDRDDRPGGILKVENYPTREFVAEQKRFYRGIRGASNGTACLAGIDIDGLPGGSYEDIVHTLAGRDASDFLRALARVPGETATQEALRLRNARTLIALDWPPSVAASLDALAESLDYIARTYSAKSYDALRPGMAFRERAMKRRLGEAQRLLNTDHLVLMGHALHLAKRDEALPRGSVGPGGGLEASLGQWLTHAQGKRLLTIWLMYGEGEDNQPLANLPRRADYPRGTLNAMLHKLTDTPLLFFPPDAPELFARPVKLGQMYNSVLETHLAEQADAVVFLPVVSPLRDDFGLKAPLPP